jgi:hypothetical protein
VFIFHDISLSFLSDVTMTKKTKKYKRFFTGLPTKLYTHKLRQSYFLDNSDGAV